MTTTIVKRSNLNIVLAAAPIPSRKFVFEEEEGAAEKNKIA